MRQETRHNRFERLEPRTMLSADPGWAFAIGGNAYQAVYDVEVGPDDNVYVLGTFSGTVDVDPGPGIVELTDSGDHGDGFIAKYTPDRELIWATRFGGADGREYSGKLNFDSAGNAYLVGFFNSRSPQFGGTTLSLEGFYDAHVAKLDSFTGQFLWAHGLGGPFNESANDVQISPTGDVYVVGTFRDTVEFDPDPVDVFQLTAVAGEDIRNAYVWKLDAQGDFKWARNLGGPLNDSGHRIALGGDGHAYVVGTFRDTVDFGEPGSPLTMTSAGLHDTFLVKLEETSGDTVWTRQISGPEGISGARIVSDGSGSLVMAGSFTGTVTFGAGTPTLVSAGGADTYLSRWDTDGNLIRVQQISGTEDVRPRTLTLDSGGSPHMGLRFKGTVDFDPGPTAATLTSTDDFDGAVLKLDTDGVFKWVRHISGPGEIRAWGVDVDSTGNVYVNGPFPDTVNLPTGDVLTSSGLIDTYVLKFTVRIPGDTNHDGRVDIDDLNNVRNNFGQSGPGIVGDTNGDNRVDINDLNEVRNNFGATSRAVEAAMEILPSLADQDGNSTTAIFDSRHVLSPRIVDDLLTERFSRWTVNVQPNKPAFPARLDSPRGMSRARHEANSQSPLDSAAGFTSTDGLRRAASVHTTRVRALRGHQLHQTEAGELLAIGDDSAEDESGSWCSSQKL